MAACCERQHRWLDAHGNTHMCAVTNARLIVGVQPVGVVQVAVQDAAQQLGSTVSRNPKHRASGARCFEEGKQASVRCWAARLGWPA